jgi:hypothetical protein
MAAGKTRESHRISRAFSGEVDTGSPQKMRPSKEIERFHDSTQHESALVFVHLQEIDVHTKSVIYFTT